MRLVRAVSDEALDDAVEHYRAEGWARLPSVVTEPALDGLRGRLDALLAGALPDPGLFFQAEGATGRYEDVPKLPAQFQPGHTWRKIEKLERDEQFAAWVRNPLFARIAASVLPGVVRLYRTVLFSKAPRVGSDTPWHQDGGRLWGLDREPELQLWLALDDAPPEAGALEVVPRSHLGGLVTPLGGVIPEAYTRDVVPLVVPADAGDLVLLHNHTWHRAGANHTDNVRRALTVCLLAGETRCLRTRKDPRSFEIIFPLV